MQQEHNRKDENIKSSGKQSTSKDSLQQEGYVCTSLPEEQSYHYRRHTSLKIKPISFDDQADQIATVQSQESHFFVNSSNVINNHSEESPQLSKKYINSKIQKYTARLTAPEEWNYQQQAGIPSQCLQYMKQELKQTYDDLLAIVSRMVSAQVSNRLLFLLGPRQSGKKTLLFLVLQQIAKCTSNTKSYYFDFEQCTRKGEQAIISLSSFILQYCLEMKEKKQGESVRPVIVVNGPQLFFHLLKKVQLYHEFKGLLRKSKIVFLFTGTAFNIRKQSWISENSVTFKTPKISLNAIISLLVIIIKQTSFESVKWTISKPLATFFCKKIQDHSNVDLSLLTKMKKFMKKISQLTKKSEENVEEKPTELKMTRDMLDKFKKECFDISYQVNIAGLNLHQKLVLVGMRRVMSQDQKLAIKLSDLYSAYRWACSSINVSGREEKQFKRDLLVQMQTYKLIRTVRKYGNMIGTFIVASIDMAQISQYLRNEPLLSKFY